MIWKILEIRQFCAGFCLVSRSNFSFLHSQMLEIQEVPILRWIPCEAQQSHWRQCGAFDHQEGSLIDIKLFCIVVCLASIMDVHFPNIIKTVDLMAVNWVSLI